MASVRSVVWVPRSVLKLWVRCMCAACRSAGSVSVALVWRVVARVRRDEGVVGLSGSLIAQREVATVCSWADSASPIMSRLDRKCDMSLARISRSESGTRF